MNNKNIVEYIKQTIRADKVKDSLENLYLYLHEIESMIKSGEKPSENTDIHDAFKYRLQIMERQIALIDETFKAADTEQENKPEYLS